MRNTIIAAVFAVCLAVPGIAQANQFTAPQQAELAQSGDLDPQLLQDILRAASLVSEYDFESLSALYEDGFVVVEKLQDGRYRVSTQDGGGIGIIAIEESI